MGFIIINNLSDTDVVWWAQLAQKVGATHDYRFGNSRGLLIPDQEENTTGDKEPANETAEKGRNKGNRFTRKIAKKCGYKKR